MKIQLGTIRRILSTGFKSCPRCGHKHIRAILTWGDKFNSCGKDKRWYYVDVKCRDKECGVVLHKSKCVGGGFLNPGVLNWFRLMRDHWNERPVEK